MSEQVVSLVGSDDATAPLHLPFKKVRTYVLSLCLHQV